MGVTLRSAYPFTFHLSRRIGRQAPVVDVDVVTTLPAELADAADGLDAVGRAPARDGELACRLIVGPSWSVLRFGEAADFYLSDTRIVCHLVDQVFRFAVDIWLFGTVLAYWLEVHGTPVLHASAVEVGDRCVGFLSANQGGKSTLAAGFLQAGHRLLSDDVLALGGTGDEVLGQPAYPQMRMWPGHASRLLGDVHGLERVQPASAKLRVPVGPGGFGAFCSDTRPVAALYVPERTDAASGDGPEVTELGVGEALVTLAGYTFLYGLVDDPASRRERFARLARVVRTVPVRRLRYPSGVDRLRDAVEAVALDVTTSAA